MSYKVILKPSSAAVLFAVVLLGLGGCKKRQQEQMSFPSPDNTPLVIVDLPTPSLSPDSGVPSVIANLPEPIRETHRGTVFLITWFAPPFSDYYDRLHLHADGSIDCLGVVVDLAFHGGNRGQLTEEEREEVQMILKAMIEVSPTKPLPGSQIITLSFLWEGDNHVLSFSESNCPGELHRLFEIAAAAFRRNPEWPGIYPNPCQEGNEYGEQAQEPILPGSTPFHLNLPEPVRRVHEAPRLFCTTWFRRPFDGSYDELSLFASDSMVYWQLVDNGGREVARGQLTERERQEIQTTLDLMTRMSPVEQPVGTTTITFSFSWEADYYLFNFGGSDCPDSLRHLFEITDTAFKRDVPELDDFRNPCQGK